MTFMCRQSLHVILEPPILRSRHLPHSLLITPIQELPERLAAMAEPCLLLSRQLSERPPDRRKIKQRIVPKTISPTWPVQNDPLRRSLKGLQSLSIPRRCQHAYKPCDTFLWWNLFQLPEQARIIFSVIRVCAGKMGLVGRIPRRVHPRGSVQRIHLQAGIIGEHDLAWRMPAVLLRLFSCVLFEGLSVLYHSEQGR